MRNAARQWMDDVKEWTGLSHNEMWREPVDCQAWRKRVSCVIHVGDSTRRLSLFLSQEWIMSNLTDVSRSIKLDPKIEHFRTQTLF